MSLETRLFAYGTLKRGAPLHHQLCRDVRAVIPARVWGRLYELPSGCPALQVPLAARLHEATADPAADHARLNAAEQGSALEYSHEGWRPIGGQLLSLADCRTAWATLDAWEDAAPSRPTLFRRMLVPVECAGTTTVLAWAYVVPELPAGSRELASAEWPLPVPSGTSE